MIVGQEAVNSNASPARLGRLNLEILKNYLNFLFRRITQIKATKEAVENA